MAGLNTDHHAVDAGYARLYGPLAVSCVVIAFLPLLEDTDGTLWELASDPAGGTAVLGAILMVVLVGCLGAAAFHPPRSVARPIVIGCLAAAILLMLVTRPGYGDDKPALAPGGNAAIAVAVLTILLGIAHAVQLWRRRQ